ncbi:hypothetical protein GS429_21440 [Natronorubrum sp. JWXQ-INN-674]|uniref:Uncharacterized protein n=1 Tax=Natronorubrum halalkaliphilum TaxID=2691917 RepID=A0A6B0VSI1_9EURY|nr:hypothetical protein [Natronorubrum halalkaliphilum]MXV64590.1 hypothetical protein [Natronorubrum halalkaliphilum]
MHYLKSTVKVVAGFSLVYLGVAIAFPEYSLTSGTLNMVGRLVVILLTSIGIFVIIHGLFVGIELAVAAGHEQIDQDN